MSRARPFLLLCACLLSAAPIFGLAQQRAPATDAAENRTALVIGNSNYKSKPLANPVNDARAMAKALNEAGFTVRVRINLTRSQIRDEIRKFGDELRDRRGVGLFYFAGHGVQVNGRNFLIPVGSDIQREHEVEDEAVDANFVLATMEYAKARMNIVILDACRDNPFEGSFRSSARGLAPMNAPGSTIIAYATAPGQTASDGTGANGIYTQRLVEQIATPGLSLSDLFINVRNAVRRDSGGRQTPWELASLTENFYFKPPVATAAQLTSAEIDKAVQAALRKREEEEAARRAAQQGEIERAVLAALKKREDEQAAAQAAKSSKETAEAKAAVERLNKELAELRAARDTGPQPPGATLPPIKASDAQVVVATPRQPAKPPVHVALAAPTSPRQKPLVAVGGHVDRPEIRVGDQWKYQVTDRYTDLKTTLVMEVATVTENRIYTRSAQAPGVTADLTTAAGVIEVWDRDWNQLRQGEMEYTPFYPNAKFPLDAGNKWAGSVKFDSGAGVTLIHDVTAQVVGWERITVPAGIFDAVRISLRGYFRIQGGSVNGSIVDTYWYAPSARQFVKKEIEHRTGGTGGSMGGNSNDTASSHQLYERWELVEYKAD